MFYRTLRRCDSIKTALVKEKEMIPFGPHKNTNPVKARQFCEYMETFDKTLQKCLVKVYMCLSLITKKGL